jgi:hypothetical protein
MYAKIKLNLGLLKPFFYLLGIGFNFDLLKGRYFQSNFFFNLGFEPVTPR